MARNMSFAFTTPQFQDGSKSVTRRMGWLHAKAGDVVCGVKKGMGLKPGEKIERLGHIRLINVRRELLRRMTDDIDYGFAECVREGYPPPHPKSWPTYFVEWFCTSHHCTADAFITRIEFEHLAPTPDREG